MDTAKFLTTLQAAGPSGAMAAKAGSGEGFAWLTKNRQRLVFETIQEGLSAVPPRPEASFDNVVKAYITLSRVVNAAAQGQLSDQHLCALEADIQAAGGVISPGLRSEGENSLASFRSATFGLLDRAFAPAVSISIQSALNAQLQKLKQQDIGEVFQAIANFLSPLTHAPGLNPTFDTFREFDNERQCNIFNTLRDAIAANPSRPDANFNTVVNAFQAEISILRKAAQGQLTDDLLSHLQASVRLAGGKLWPNLYSEGENSIQLFRESTFGVLNQTLAPEVVASVVSALNNSISRTTIADASSLFAEIETFLTPLLPGCWDTPASKDFKNLDARRQALVFRTLEARMASQAARSPKLFDFVVRAFSLERHTIEQARQGALTVECLQNLCLAVEQCGGSLASGLVAYGSGSLAESIDTYLLELQASLPVDVFNALLSALNAKLRTTTIQDVDDITLVIAQFLAPVQAGLTSELPSPDVVETGLAPVDPVAPEWPQPLYSDSLEIVSQQHTSKDNALQPALHIAQPPAPLPHVVAEAQATHNHSTAQALSGLPTNLSAITNRELDHLHQTSSSDSARETSIGTAEFGSSPEPGSLQNGQVDSNDSPSAQLIDRDAPSDQTINDAPDSAAAPDFVAAPAPSVGAVDASAHTLVETTPAELNGTAELCQHDQADESEQSTLHEPVSFYPEVHSQSLIFEVPPDSGSAKKKHSAA